MSYQLETSGKTATAGVYDYRYYNCRNHLRTGKERCDGYRIREQALDIAVLNHLAERLFTDEACREILRDFVEETGVLRQRTADQRRQLQIELDGIERRLQRWAEAFETGEMSAELGAERVAELRAKREELREAIRKVVPLRPPPPHLYGEATIRKFRDSLRAVFLGNETSMTKNYLRFLVEKIVVTADRVQLVAKTDAVVRLMSAGGKMIESPSASGTRRLTGAGGFGGKRREVEPVHHAREGAVGKGWANPLGRDDFDVHVGALREAGVTGQERVGAGLDGTREVDSVGDLEAVTRAKLGRALEHGGGHVEEEEATRAENRVVLSQENGIVVPERLHATFQSREPRGDELARGVRSNDVEPAGDALSEGVRALDEVDERRRVERDAGHRSPQESRSSAICRSMSSLVLVPGGSDWRTSKMSRLGTVSAWTGRTNTSTSPVTSSTGSSRSMRLGPLSRPRTMMARSITG